MLPEPPEPSAVSDAHNQSFMVRLFRLWAMARETGENPVTWLYRTASRHGYPDETANACASLFELVEGHLGRRLIRERCCNRIYSSDEKALLGVVRAAPSLSPPYANITIPHGLPGAIYWAAMAVRRALSITGIATATARKCPFGPSAQGGAAAA